MVDNSNFFLEWKYFREKRTLHVNAAFMDFLLNSLTKVAGEDI